MTADLPGDKWVAAVSLRPEQRISQLDKGPELLCAPLGPVALRRTDSGEMWGWQALTYSGGRAEESLF